MDAKRAVKEITRAHLLDEGALTFKVLATAAVPERRLRKAADDEEPKDLRVWELREVLPGALRADPTAALDLLSDLLGLRDAGVIIALAPRGERATDIVTEAAEATEAVVAVQAKARQAAADGVTDPEEAIGLDRGAVHAERELLQVRELARRAQAPQRSFLEARP
jgi:hypothetical protein